VRCGPILMSRTADGGKPPAPSLITKLWEVSIFPFHVRPSKNRRADQRRTRVTAEWLIARHDGLPIRIERDRVGQKHRLRHPIHLVGGLPKRTHYQFISSLEATSVQVKGAVIRHGKLCAPGVSFIVAKQRSHPSDSSNGGWPSNVGKLAPGIGRKNKANAIMVAASARALTLSY